MSPRHFYRSQYPKAASEDDRGLHNAFVSFTHVIGLKRFFSYVPPLFDRDAWRAEHSGDKTSGDKEYTKPSHKHLYK